MIYYIKDHISANNFRIFVQMRTNVCVIRLRVPTSVGTWTSPSLASVLQTWSWKLITGLAVSNSLLYYIS